MILSISTANALFLCANANCAVLASLFKLKWLHTIKKVDGKYRFDFRPEGVKGKRVIRCFDRRVDAVRFQQEYVSRLSDTKAVQAIVDDRHLNDLIQSWFDLHGRSLKSASKTMKKLFRLSGFLGNPIARLIKPETFAAYRSNRLDSGILPATLNRELITLKAVYRELKRMLVIDYDSPVLSVRTIRESKKRTVFFNSPSD